MDCHAEEGEWGVSAVGGILVPSYKSTTFDALDAVAGFGGVGLSYGLQDDLWVDVRATLTDLRGQITEQVAVSDEQVIVGRLQFSTTQAHLAGGLRFNLWPGTSSSPYLFASGGVLIALFRDQRLLNDEGLIFGGVALPARPEVQPMVAAGLSLEYRVDEGLVLGIEPIWTKALGGGRVAWFASIGLKVTVLLGDG